MSHNEEFLFDDNRVSVWDEEVQVDGSGDGGTTMGTYLVPLNCHFKTVKMVNFRLRIKIIIKHLKF